jgi:hypothetical protein
LQPSTVACACVCPPPPVPSRGPAAVSGAAARIDSAELRAGCGQCGARRVVESARARGEPDEVYHTHIHRVPVASSLIPRVVAGPSSLQIPRRLLLVLFTACATTAECQSSKCALHASKCYVVNSQHALDLLSATVENIKLKNKMWPPSSRARAQKRHLRGALWPGDRAHAPVPDTTWA